MPFTLVSARALFEMEEAINKLALTQPQIGFNGGLIFQKDNDHYKIIKEKTIDSAIALKIIQLIENEFPQITLCVYDEKYWYAAKIDRGTQLETQLTGFEPNITNLEELCTPSRKIFKLMMLIFEEKLLQQVTDTLQQHFGKNVMIQRSGEYWLEITSNQAKKSSGIQYIMDLEKLSKNETAAFGDGRNDIPMFQSVGLPIAMTNASTEIKQYAQKITDSNDLNGVGTGVHKYLMH
ncbi:HAD family hydrolase [Ligilactobacillus sp. LYQ135]